jgi:hypothetical protein
MDTQATPDMLDLLRDGVPRIKKAILAVLVGRRPKENIGCTLMRLAVTGQLVDIGSKCILAPDGGTGQR